MSKSITDGIQNNSENNGSVRAWISGVMDGKGNGRGGHTQWPRLGERTFGPDREALYVRKEAGLDAAGFEILLIEVNKSGFASMALTKRKRDGCPRRTPVDRHTSGSQKQFGRKLERGLWSGQAWALSSREVS
ncbi:hypothetical protein PLEOSDRAFT_170062 [Pleurotus ostreatus PC15]|uniref:Uncharacterized protein n=1 Tax=Pleurotus ostreatus (strain PC15) TaxID=1137138 RepID=A0A067NAH1_PLEO1|nr:hypothetical protein PLEOSDRAFT_170062 [Pleurotus ostreatus PC15]